MVFCSLRPNIMLLVICGALTQIDADLVSLCVHACVRLSAHVCVREWTKLFSVVEAIRQYQMKLAKICSGDLNPKILSNNSNKKIYCPFWL